MKIPFSQLKTMPRTCRLRGLERKWGGLVGAWKGLGWGLGSIPCDAHSLQLPHYMYIVSEPNAHSLQLPHYMYIVFEPNYIRNASRNAHILRAAKRERERERHPRIKSSLAWRVVSYFSLHQKQTVTKHSLRYTSKTLWAPRGKTHQLLLTSASLDISARTKSIETTARKMRTNYFLTLANTPVSENKNVRFYVSRFSCHVVLFVVFSAASAYHYDPSCSVLKCAMTF